MARADMAGFWWDDTPPPKPPKKEAPKRTPPEPVWLKPDYLPGLEEALAFPVKLFEDTELVLAAQTKERLVFDIECYSNYFLIAFKSIVSQKVVYFERTETEDFDHRKLDWILHNFCLISFNGIKYDLPILSLAMAGCSTAQLKAATNEIIELQAQPWQLLRRHKVKSLAVNHIDLIEVAPLFATLKIYGGRLHCRRMQDLPFHPATRLSRDQIAITRWYCINDLDNTELLYRSLDQEIELREQMSQEYGIDLRSKSDAQIAEAVIGSELEKLMRRRCQKPVILPGHKFHYQAPSFLKYSTPLMNAAFQIVKETPFEIADDGTIDLPLNIKALKLQLADSTYRMGIGGLHSSEKRAAHVADNVYELHDRDVTSFYPQIILLLRLYPKHLGTAFLTVYKGIVDRRIQAKRANKKSIAETLKILVNGSFGKLGSPHSIFYAPELLIQVTLTGQLSLLMLIERLELAGISVVSGNTDGIVIKPRKEQVAQMEAIIKQWEQDTGFSMEETAYTGVYSRDVNNYLATKPDGKYKAKGVFALPERAAERLHKNPTNEICSESVVKFLTTGASITKSIRECRDIRKFVSVRTVDGGAVTPDLTYLGKSIRFYYAAGVEGFFVYARSGNKVPRTEGAKPLMTLPDVFPDDINYEWYEAEAFRMLEQIGAEAA